MAETSHQRDLDWNNLAHPVPLGLIDPEFAPPGNPPGREFPAAPGEDSAEPIGSAAGEPAGNSVEAKAEAGSTARDEAGLKAEAEEAAQRARLEQWMANARARLQMADEDPIVPGAPVRIRREPSPTLIRLAEMQKTLFDADVARDEIAAEGVGGSSSVAGPFAGSRGLRMPVDPMATIIVHKDAFVEAPEQRVLPAPPIPVAAIAPQPSTEDPRTAKLKAVERKVAQIRLAEAGAETLIMGPVAQPARANVRLAIWALGGLIPVILGLGLYALTQAGYLDGLEDLVPALTGSPPAKTPPQNKAAAPRPAAMVRETAQAEKARAQIPAVFVPTAPVPAAPPIQTTAGTARRSKVQTVTRKIRPIAATSAPAMTPGAADPAPFAPPSAAAANPLENARRNAEASMAGVQVAQTVHPGGSASAGQGEAEAEAELKSSVGAALRRDAEAVQAIYDRFAMGMPGLSGEVIIGITVNPDGRILEGSIASTTTGAPSFDQELLRKILDWKLPSFADVRPRYVAVPFHFEPKGP